MSKIFSLYTKNKDGLDVDRVWYESSNIKYSECIDNDNDLKTLMIVFNNGSQYQYEKVDVKNYLMFRDSLSQGKALNEYIKNKNYPYKKIEAMDIEELNEEFNFRYSGGVFVDYDGKELIVKDNRDNVVFKKEAKLTMDGLNIVCGVLSAVGKDVKLTTTDEFDKEENNDE